MKHTLPCLAAASLLTFAAHAQTTGVSRPEAIDDTITASTPAPSGDHYHKPSAGTPVQPDASVPAPVTAPAATVQAAPPYASTPTPALHRPHEVDPDDPDSGVVVAIHAEANEVPEGTLLRVTLDKDLNTTTARPGDHFTGHLTRDVVRDGHVMLHAGSVIQGRITEVRQSRRFTSDAMMRLQPDTITGPDGIPYPLSAQLIDFDHQQDIKYDSQITNEGEVVSDPHTRQKVGALALTTGGAAAAGAMVAGGVGFLVGATIGAGANVILWGKEQHEQRLPAGTIMVLDINHSLFLNASNAQVAPVAAAPQY